MPSAFLPFEGQLYANRVFLRDPALTTYSWYLRLFTAPSLPLMSNSWPDFVEPAWAPYAPILLDPGQWLPPVTFTFGATSYYKNSPQIFTPTSGSHTVAGWFVSAATSLVIMCQAFDAPFVASPTNPLIIQPVWCAQGVYQPL